MASAVASRPFNSNPMAKRSPINVNFTKSMLQIFEETLQSDLVCPIGLHGEPNNHLRKFVQRQNVQATRQIRPAARNSQDEATLLRGFGPKVMVCHFCQDKYDVKDMVHCNSCARCLCAACDDKFHSKAGKTAHEREKLALYVARNNFTVENSERLVKRNPAILAELKKLTDGEYSSKELAVILALYARSRPFATIKPNLLDDATTWYINAVVDLREKITNNLMRLRGVRCTLSLETIRAEIVATGSLEEASVRCVNRCKASIDDFKEIYPSLQYEDICDAISHCNSGIESTQVHDELNLLVAASFADQLVDIYQPELNLLAYLRRGDISDQERRRCIIGQYQVDKQTANALLELLLKGDRTDDWLCQALQIFGSDISIPVRELATHIDVCVACQKALPKSKFVTLACRCTFCQDCIVQALNRCIPIGPLDRLNCPNCNRLFSQIYGENFMESFHKLITSLYPMLSAAAQKSYDQKVVDAALDNEVITFECLVCVETKPIAESYAMFTCQCKNMCRACAKTHFEIMINEKNVAQWTCYGCDQPDDSDVEKVEQFLWHLEATLRLIIDEEIHTRFSDKITEWTMRKDERFRWCKCGNGFIWEGANAGRLCMQCPKCRRLSCFKCEKDWEKQHEGITCEQFEKWKSENDPDYQTRGLKAYLEEQGITCPNPGCKTKYALARGGCLHFHCRACTWEFCGCCGARYFKSENCKVDSACVKRGLHAHCEPNCFYFLRDETVLDLQALLKKHNVKYRFDGQEADEEQALSARRFRPRRPNAAIQNGTCEVEEQKDNGEDGVCSRDICAEAGDSQLCEIHYKEYLVDIIRKHNIRK